MAHPSFIDRSFAQMARRAIARCSYGTPREGDLAQAIINRAKLADAAAARGPHSEQGRAYDRRIGIGRRARMVAALVMVASELAKVA